MRKDEIQNLAKSLMLEINEKEIDDVSCELDLFFKQVDQINQIDTDKVIAQSYPFEDAVGKLRDDVEGEVLAVDEVLSNAMETDADMVKIPKVVV